MFSKSWNIVILTLLLITYTHTYASQLTLQMYHYFCNKKNYYRLKYKQRFVYVLYYLTFR